MAIVFNLEIAFHNRLFPYQLMQDYGAGIFDAKVSFQFLLCFKTSVFLKLSIPQLSLLVCIYVFLSYCERCVLYFSLRVFVISIQESYWFCMFACTHCFDNNVYQLYKFSNGVIVKSYENKYNIMSSSLFAVLQLLFFHCFI